VNAQNHIIFELWDGKQLRVTFRRCFDHRLILQWYEVLQIPISLHLKDENDALIWMWDFFS
jgi:hypothetical protein